VPGPAARRPHPPDMAGELARSARRAGGRLLIVGGWVRDAQLGRSARDLDFELYGFDRARARAWLDQVGVRSVDEVGRSFPVLLVRREGSSPFELTLADPQLDADFAAQFARNARRRDLTVNALGLDPLTGEWLDPYGGREDLAARRLRAVDATRFGEDPLRALRVARLAADLDAEPDERLLALCGEQDLGSVAVERLYRELSALLATQRPSRGLSVLARSRSLAHFPELAALEGLAQDPRWHPEGCVWTHTLMVVDEAARLRTGEGERDDWLMWAALLHDLGKPETTKIEPDAVRSHAHDTVGAELAYQWLVRWRAPAKTVEAVRSLVRHHLAPALLVGQGATDRGFRRLARRLAASGVDAALLQLVARADHLGRTTDEARARRFPAGDAFAERMRSLDTLRAPVAMRVRGRDVLARGVEPGPEVGAILARCEAIADETGWSDPQRILDRALRGGTRGRSG